MAAVSTDQVTRQRGSDRASHPAKASTLHYEGVMAFLNAGLAEAGINSGNNKFAGIVARKTDNSAGADSALAVEVFRKGHFLLTGASLAIGDVGATVYATDNYTITKTSTNNVAVGKIVNFVSSTQVWVDIEGFAV